MITFKGNTVMSVYSGKDGACCCGCAGKHTYFSDLQRAASKDRGYKVTHEEINDRTVKFVVNKLVKFDAAIDESKEFASVVVNDRLYVAYFVPAGV